MNDSPNHWRKFLLPTIIFLIKEQLKVDFKMVFWRWLNGLRAIFRRAKKEEGYPLSKKLIGDRIYMFTWLEKRTPYSFVTRGSNLAQNTMQSFTPF